jgi:hypothetical protein
LKPSALASKASPYCRRFDRGVSSYNDEGGSP